ncbi:unnamed protein product [Parnassius apollo]|uniref:(apollo) hypothetical protein n=1 Tax=Parnassius apollo TaxID=110799 RepID=A0A8S3Y683_PARAO|nr:unnamed protein product [Parnassius apollo]
MYWNPDGIRQKLQELRTVAQQQDIHIILLGETILNPKTQIKLPNFHIYRRDEVTSQGAAYRGTAVLVRRDIVHQELELPSYQTMRSIGIRMEAAGEELRIYAAYHPPGTPFCSSDIRRVMEGDTPIIIAGDLNAKNPAWGSRVITPPGLELYEDAEKSLYDVLGPEEPTHVPTDPRRHPDVLDIVLTRNVNYPIVVEVLYDLPSQHLPLLITLGLKAVTTPPRAFKTRVDWRLYCQHIQQRPPAHHPISTANDVEAAATRITNNIKEALHAASTVVPITARRDDLPREICVQIKRKRALRKLWARTRCPRIKTQLNTLSEELSVAVQAFRGEAWDRRIQKADEYDASLYKLNRQLTKTKPPVCPLTNNAGKRCYDAKGRADILVEHFEEQFMPNPASAEFMELHARKESRVQEFLSSPAPPLAGEWFISPAELRRTVTRLQPRKAPGHDGITNAALRQLPNRVLVELGRLYNGILRTSHFPEDWKKGKVIVLPKPGKDRRRAASYRPITLLPHIAKLFERLLLRRLRPCI